MVGGDVVDGVGRYLARVEDDIRDRVPLAGAVGVKRMPMLTVMSSQERVHNMAAAVRGITEGRE